MILIHLAAAAAVFVLALISTHLVYKVPDTLLSILCLVELLTLCVSLISMIPPCTLSRLKYLNNYWIDYHEILYRHAWRPENELS